MPGPLTNADLLQLWNSVTDEGYSQPIVQAGSGNGYEVIEQAAEQFAAVADAINTSAQELYVLPHSGQTGEPASGARKATAEITLTRTARFTVPLVLDPTVAVEEVAIDFSPDGPVDVRTGRAYLLAARVVLAPGAAGPVTVQLVADRPGSGHNHPLPESLRGFREPGAKLGNDLATIEPGVGTHRLRAANKPDVPVPSHVGLQVELLAGLNAGQVRRVVGYLPPEGDDSGSLLIAPTAVLAVTTVVGTFEVGELVTQASGARGTFLALSNGRVIVDGDGVLEFGAATLTGSDSGATATVTIVEQGQTMTAEAAGATWRVLSYVDLGLVTTNERRPSGGRDASLDEIGLERDVRRAPDEDDDTFRMRVAAPSDTVSPAAVVRAANRALAQFGVEARLREVGTPAFPGAFLDGEDSYDNDAITVAGTISGAFLDGELVAQVPGGVGAVALGRAQVRSPAAAGPLPAALAAPVLQAVSGLLTAEPFVSGVPLFGLTSSASIANPTITGGLRPDDRLKLQLGYEDFRGFFLVGAPVAGLGEFGCAYDAGPCNAYDAAPFHAFYDGFAATTALALRALWQSVDEVRAGGVGFDLEIDASL